MSKRHIAIMAILIATISAGHATTRYVAQDGQTPDPGPPAYTNWNVAASNIQDAVDAAASGDVILVNTGRYTSTNANIVVIENKALELVGVGGAVTLNGAAALVSLENSTLVGNRSRDVGGGGIGIRGDAACAVTNSIVYYNQDRGGSTSRDNVFIALLGGVPQGTLSMAFSSTTRPAPPAGFGNIELEPGFIDPGSDYGTNHIAGNYHLAKGAPCIDAGTNLAWTATAVDLDGNPRRDGSFGIVDMGAYEYMYKGTLITVQ